MTNNITNWVGLGFLGLALVALPSTSHGQAKKGEAVPSANVALADAKKPVDPDRKLPFHGKVVSVDKAAKTIKISNRVFKVMSDTQITKFDKAATLDHAVIGEVTGGSYKNNNGTLELVKLRLGPKVEDLPKVQATPTTPTVAKSSKPVAASKK